MVGPGAGKGTRGNFFLGRPWGDYARVVFQNSDEDGIIISEGWEGLFYSSPCICYATTCLGIFYIVKMLTKNSLETDTVNCQCSVR